MDQGTGQKLTLVDRKRLNLEGVRYVGNFDEREIVLETNMGALYLKGEGLNITKLNLDEGTLSVDGYINSMEYREAKSARARGKSMLSRLMK